MNVIALTSGPIENNTYIVSDDSGRCVLIDAPFEVYRNTSPYLTERGLKPTHIFITHTHWDHIGGLAEFKRATNVGVYVHKDDAVRLSQSVMELGGNKISIEVVEPDIILNGGEVIEVGDMKFEVLHTPGHSLGAVCYLERKEKIVFVGDTLFNMSIGRTDFVGSDYNTLVNSIKTQLLVLPDDTVVYCGHNEPTTIGFERANNPFLN